MQAIITKYIGPSNTRGSRVKATCDAGGLIVPWAYELGAEGNHRAAAYALRDKLEWAGELIGGSIGNKYVWVFVS